MAKDDRPNQNMTHSPGGIQVGRDLHVNMNQGRRLPENQKQLLIEGMSREAGRDGTHLVTCILGDGEGASLATDLVDAFRRAGWNLPGSGFSQAVFGGVVRGIVLKVHSEKDAELPTLQRLIAILGNAGLERSGVIDPSIPPGDFRIIVGSRP